MRGSWRCASAALIVMTIDTVAVPRAAADVVKPWEGVGENLQDIYGWPNGDVHGIGVCGHAAARVDARRAAAGSECRRTTRTPIRSARHQHRRRAHADRDPLALYGVGASEKATSSPLRARRRCRRWSSNSVVVSALKWLSIEQRPCPDGDPAQRSERTDDAASDRASDFDYNPLELDRGLWPSGHTASNFALVSSLLAFYPDEIWLPIVGYPSRSRSASG